MRRRNNPVQQWVDSLPSPVKTASNLKNFVKQKSLALEPDLKYSTQFSSFDNQDLNEKENHNIHKGNMTVSIPINVPNSPAITHPGVSMLTRDSSFQSDSSHCSSIESLLESRKADPEAILLSLGFGGCSSTPQDSGPLSRIPKRFLQPSKLKGIAITDFVKQQQETTESLDSASLGYRGLTGSPNVAPSEIVKKIMERLREHDSYELDAYAPYNNNYIPPQQDGRLSVLSPDNRQFLDRPRSKSPDMRNKRMIIGQKSFAFGNDGDLIEIHNSKDIDNEHFPFYDDSSDSNVRKSMFIVNDNFKLSYHDLPTEMESKGSNENRYDTELATRNSELQISVQDNESLSKRSELRRFSAGTKAGIDATEDGTGSSEGTLNDIKLVNSRGDSFKTKKYCLKRQAKIPDFGASSNTGVLDSQLLNIDPLLEVSSKSFESNSDDETVSLVDGNEALKNNSHCSHSKCSEGEEVSCCYKKKNDNCRKKMIKVLKKNKKLENVVAQNRQEMAEIRDMLSSVLTVRMEPGF